MTHSPTCWAPPARRANSPHRTRVSTPETPSCRANEDALPRRARVIGPQHRADCERSVSAETLRRELCVGVRRSRQSTALVLGSRKDAVDAEVLMSGWTDRGCGVLNGVLALGPGQHRQAVGHRHRVGSQVPQLCTRRGLGVVQHHRHGRAVHVMSLALGIGANIALRDAHTLGDQRLAVTAGDKPLDAVATAPCGGDEAPCRSAVPGASAAPHVRT